MALTEQQQEIRRTGIGASEIAALAGLSKWATPIQIYERKIGTAPPLESLPAELGNLLEEPIAQVYAKRTSRHLVPVTTLRHRALAYALATPDRAAFLQPPTWARKADPTCHNVELLRDAERLVQIKSTSWRMASEWGTPGSDEVPEDYLAQVTWEMGVAEQSICDLAVLFDKDRFEIYTVHFSPELFAGLYSIAERFMVDHVLARVAPPPDASDRYGEYLGRAFPRDSKKDMVPMPPELARTVETFALLKSFEKAIKGALKLQKHRICAAIGENTGMAGDFGSFTWKKAKDSTGVDWKSAAEDMRALASHLLERFGAELKEEEARDLGERLRALEANHRKVKPGSRRLLPKWSPELLERLPVILTMEPLLEMAAGAEGDTDQDES